VKAKQTAAMVGMTAFPDLLIFDRLRQNSDAGKGGNANYVPCRRRRKMEI
jgi:hypothetical protein